MIRLSSADHGYPISANMTCAYDPVIGPQSIRCPICEELHYAIYNILEDTCVQHRGDSCKYHYFPKEKCCPSCNESAERKFIRDLSLENLPLWISHVWIYGSSDELYSARLKGEV